MNEVLTTTPWVLPPSDSAAGFPVSDPVDRGSAEAVRVLTAGLARGDESAWRHFHDSYFGRLFRYLLVVLQGDEQAARDALQQTLIRVHRHARRFDSEAAFWSWLCVLARSAARDGVRHRNRYTAFLAAYAHEWFGSVEAEAGDADGVLNGCLQQVLREIPAEERAMLTAKYEGRRTILEIAAESGTSAKAVESRLARIRARLRTELLKRLRHEEQS